MILFDDIYAWEGWGGKFRLGSGRCRLRIFDLRKAPERSVVFFRHWLVVAEDLPKERPQDVSVKSCNSHIATSVARDFHLGPQRMQFVEYYPRRTYGTRQEHVIEERFEAVDFTWHEGRATKPVYRFLEPALAELLSRFLQGR